MFSAIQQCPTCGGAIPREHFVMLTADGWPWIVTRLLCEHCDIGIEAVWRQPGDPTREPVLRAKTVYTRARNPLDYDKFLQRLESASNDRDVVRAANRELGVLVA